MYNSISLILLQNTLTTKTQNFQNLEVLEFLARMQLKQGFRQMFGVFIWPILGLKIKILIFPGLI